MTLKNEALDLVFQHDKLARELYDDATSAARDANFYRGDILAEQADLHAATSLVISRLLEVA